MIDGIPNWLLWFYLGSVFVELYFFLMQRSALELCRVNSLPDQARFAMLPPWYRLAWIPKIGKWTAIVLVFSRTGMDWGIAALLFPFMLSAWFPIVPHRHFAPVFTKHLARSNMSPDAATARDALRGSGML